MNQNFININIRNGKYAVKDALGAYGVPKALPKLDSINMEANVEEQEIYGDGDLMAILINDKGYTGELVLVSKEHDFEKDLGMAMDLAEVEADVQILGRPTIAVYVEVELVTGGVNKTAKVWYLDVVVSRSSDGATQKKDGAPAIRTYNYPIRVTGDFIMNAAGTAIAIDENGNQRRATRLRKLPTHPNYLTFGDAVPVPKMSA